MYDKGRTKSVRLKTFLATFFDAVDAQILIGTLSHTRVTQLGLESAADVDSRNWLTTTLKVDRGRNTACSEAFRR